MKAKVNLNSDALKTFFIAHGEKVAFAVLLGLAAWCGYAASQIPVYGEGTTAGFGGGKPKTAADLKSEIEVADQNLKSSDKRLDLAQDGVAPPKEKFGDIVKRLFLSKINPATFGGIEWNRPLQDMKSRRTEPTYLAARDVRASFHFGALRFSANNEKSIKGEEWICVTALVPFEQQIDEYRKAFENAADAKTNAVPKYYVYEIRRMEVDPNASADAPLNWDEAKPLNLVDQIDTVMASWDGTSRELAEYKYTQWPFLTQPLPPVADSMTLGEWAAHVPEVPMFQAGGAAPQPVAPAPAAPAGGVFGNAVKNPATVPAVAPLDAQAEANQKPPANYLLRFFDFNIEPGKAYRYQVRLVFNNPNKDLNPAFLERHELATGDYRMAPWSNPSPAARFPHLETFFAGDLESANGDLEATANVAIRVWLPVFGADVFYEYAKRFRGAMLNANGADVYFRVPGKPESANQKSDMNSQAMLVDFSWERGPARQLTAEGRPINRPSEVLILSPRGELIIRPQLMNWSLWEEFKGLVAGGAAPQPGAGPGPIPAPGGDRPSPFQLK